jgi:WD40 repeat protein
VVRINSDNPQSREILLRDPTIWGARFSRDARYFAKAGSSKVSVYDLERGVLWRERNFTDPMSPGAGVFPLAVSPNGNLLITSLPSSDLFTVWDLVNDREVTSWRTKGVPQAFTPDGSEAVEFLPSGRSAFRSVLSGEIREGNSTVPNATGAHYSPDGRIVAVSSWQGSVTILDGRSLEELRQVQGFLQSAHCVSFSPDGQRLLAGGSGQEAVKIWTVAGGHELLTLPGEGSVFHSCAISRNGRVLAALNQNEILHIWRAPSLEEIDPTKARP